MSVLLWLLLIAAVVGLLWSLYRQPPPAELLRRVPPNGFEGTTLKASTLLKLSPRLPTRFFVEDLPPRTVIATTPLTLGGMALGPSELETHTALSLNKRGLFQWPGVTLHWADPFGLFWRSAPLQVAPCTLTVFPATHGLILPQLLRPLLSEGEMARSLGLDDPMSLRGMRDYVAGDPLGRVHWRRSASRMGLPGSSDGLLVRETEKMASGQLTVYLDLQHASEVYLESAVRLAASLLREAEELSLPVSVASSASTTPSGRQASHIFAALSALAQAQPTTEAPRIPALRGGNLIIITQRAGAALVQEALRARGSVSRVSIVALPEGFYLEPGEQPRRQWAAAPASVRELQAQAGALAAAGVLVYVLRGNQSVLRLAESGLYLP